jgi:predicted transcriptional regulator
MLELLLVLSVDCPVDCETMLDLSTLGRELRTRRRALRIPSAELARKIGVSQTYVWLPVAHFEHALGLNVTRGESTFKRVMLHALIKEHGGPSAR